MSAIRGRRKQDKNWKDRSIDLAPFMNRLGWKRSRCERLASQREASYPPYSGFQFVSNRWNAKGLRPWPVKFPKKENGAGKDRTSISRFTVMLCQLSYRPENVL